MAEVSISVIRITDVLSVSSDCRVSDTTMQSFYDCGSICNSITKDINPHMAGLKHVYECSTRNSMLRTHGQAETVDKNEVTFRRLNHE